MGPQVTYRAIVSDLHLGEGRALENFIYDAAFQSFARHVAEEGRRRSGTAELILNGDVIDFLQIAPFEVGSYRVAIQKPARTLGAHKATFAQLSRFVESRSRLL